MTDDEAKALARTITQMNEETKEFSKEFSNLTDAQLQDVADKQSEIAAEAEFKQEAAETELRLRELRGALLQSS